MSSPDALQVGTVSTYRGGEARILAATFHTEKRFDADIIQCDVPTNDSEEDERDNFYNIFSTIIQDRPTRNTIILMGDFNAKIGSSICLSKLNTR
ncbi:hypothetical protein DPMN_004798 [Dreissena polymorpha]|uniref:Uncharacterized protein n=1 Tax=Dreissena polymorpha TaxID=45954 RepID=A0A9D4RTA8_DREPO|nr:hypothetical protein DPMN_004798 [Dreissena polymorpha]